MDSGYAFPCVSNAAGFGEEYSRVVPGVWQVPRDVSELHHQSPPDALCTLTGFDAVLVWSSEIAVGNVYGVGSFYGGDDCGLECCYVSGVAWIVCHLVSCVGSVVAASVAGVVGNDGVVVEQDLRECSEFLEPSSVYASDLVVVQLDPCDGSVVEDVVCDSDVGDLVTSEVDYGVAAGSCRCTPEHVARHFFECVPCEVDFLDGDAVEDAERQLGELVAIGDYVGYVDILEVGELELGE